jgi:hypothetical protein
MGTIFPKLFVEAYNSNEMVKLLDGSQFSKFQNGSNFGVVGIR